MFVRPFGIKKISKSQKNSEKTRKKVIPTKNKRRKKIKFLIKFPKKILKIGEISDVFREKLKITQNTAQNAFVRPSVTKKLIE